MKFRVLNQFVKSQFRLGKERHENEHIADKEHIKVLEKKIQFLD